MAKALARVMKAVTDSIVNILLIEDDLVDVRLVQRAFEKKPYIKEILVASDGQQALALLRGEDQPPLAGPFVILLDLNLPRMSGIEFLAALRGDPDLHSAMVFVLTTSNAEQDKVEAYSFNVAGYLVKSEAGPKLTKLVPLFEHYIALTEFPPMGRQIS